MNTGDVLVVIKGAGDLATGIAYRFARAGCPVICTEIAQPLVVRRTVAFAEAVRAGSVIVEGMEARRAGGSAEALALACSGVVAVLVDPDATVVRDLRPAVLVDAIIAKRNLGTRRDDAPVVIGIGPGFTAGGDCDAVIETNRGHDLGRVLLHGSAEPDTGVPGAIGGFSAERLLRAPADGPIVHCRHIADVVQPGDVVATVAGEPIISEIEGVLRGLIEEGTVVRRGLKVGDVDPRARPEHCFTISDKSLAIGGGALEAALFLLRRGDAPAAAAD